MTIDDKLQQSTDGELDESREDVEIDILGVICVEVKCVSSHIILCVVLKEILTGVFMKMFLL